MHGLIGPINFHFLWDFRTDTCSFFVLLRLQYFYLFMLMKFYLQMIILSFFSILFLFLWFSSIQINWLLHSNPTQFKQLWVLFNILHLHNLAYVFQLIRYVSSSILSLILIGRQLSASYTIYLVLVFWFTLDLL
jgi:hypothetical protein